jgi:hypothetical protein
VPLIATDRHSLPLIATHCHSLPLIALEVQASVARLTERVKRLGQLRSAVGQARGTVWDLMQRRVAMLIGNAPMNKLTVDQFLDAVSGISRFMAIGEAFSGSDSLGLRQAVRFKGKAYLAHFHRCGVRRSAAECGGVRRRAAECGGERRSAP